MHENTGFDNTEKWIPNQQNSVVQRYLAISFWFLRGRMKPFHSDKQIWKEKETVSKDLKVARMIYLYAAISQKHGIIMNGWPNTWKISKKKIDPLTIWRGGAAEGGDMSERKSTDSPLETGFPAEHPPKFTCFGSSPSPLFSDTVCQP